MHRFEFLEHTADIGLKAYGDGLEQCFENAALGMFQLLFGESPVNEVGEYEVMLEADNLDQLLVDWLSEILYLHEADALAFKSCSVKLDGCKLDARILGESFDSERHAVDTQIKAVTYHMLEVDDEKGYVQVLFDI
jgi:SHS2 domain-containing protein